MRSTRIIGIIVALLALAVFLSVALISRSKPTPTAVMSSRVVSADRAPAQSIPAETKAKPDFAAAAILARLSVQHEEVKSLLAQETDKRYSVADHMVMLGRSMAAYGRFDLSAAAYAKFLVEIGPDHEHSEEVALRLGESLAPLNLDHTGVEHSAAGPIPIVHWQMEYTPTEAALLDAVAAYTYAADIATTPEIKGKALLNLGWVHRARSAWEAATAAWDQCAEEAPGTTLAAEALRKAADNLAWTGQPLAAADRLTTLVRDCEGLINDVNIPALIEDLEAEGRRTSDWLRDPVTSLQSEIQQRAGALAPGAVYRSVARWLCRIHNDAALVTIAQWARVQDAWPLDARVRCHNDLVEALLRQADAEQNSAKREQAAGVLGELMAILPEGEPRLQVAQARYRLLSDLGAYALADQTWDDASAQFQANPAWETTFLDCKIRSLLSRGDVEGAQQTYAQLESSYPDYGVTWETFQNTGGGNEGNEP